MPSPDPKLAPNFDPIWVDDFECLAKGTLTPVAFIVRQLLRLHRDLETNLVNLPDTEIERMTGIVRKSIRRARRLLIATGNIEERGYHLYYICPSSWVKMTQPAKNRLGQNDPSLGSKRPNHLGQKDPSLGSKRPNPIINRTDNTETDRNFPLEIQDDEILTFRILFPWENRNLLSGHLTARGLTESEAGKIFERVYPQQYTGKSK